MKERYLRIADCVVRTRLSETMYGGMASLEPFVCDGTPSGMEDMVFSEGVFERPVSEPDETFSNDAGHVCMYDCGDDGYVFSVAYTDALHYMKCSRDFSNVTVMPDSGDAFLGAALQSMLRIAFAQRVVLLDGFSIHSSCVVLDGKAYLFLGPSGAGKSTHSRMWLSAFPEARLLNDDNPICRMGGDGVLRAYGSPWSGKTPCYRNASDPVEAFVRIIQAPDNSLGMLRGVMAWTTIFSACSLISQDDFLYLSFEKTLNSVVGRVKVASLRCTPGEEAALLCFKTLNDSKI